MTKSEIEASIAAAPDETVMDWGNATL